MSRDSHLTILLVDDNPQIRSFLRPALEDSGFRCVEAADGDEAVYLVEESNPDLIVLDIELGDPDMDGLDVCKRIRNLGHTIPVIFLTVRATVEDLEHGLQVAGPGSDYVRKMEELRRMQVEGKGMGDVQVAIKAPDTHELIARIRARLPNDVQQFDADLRIDRCRMIVEKRNSEGWLETPLQQMEYEVFTMLVAANGRVVGTWDLFDQIFHSEDDETDDIAIDNYKNRIWVCISNLRKKIDPDGTHNYIQTVHGIGYRFRAVNPS
ncbi:MAG: response regulator transcription factor [SAR202 cluster bacterium]|nr:response regulator transcription factor [SAR202 cluster bacterium]MDP6512237.1 response regulator transcription factor [SAR202 cluster bacterium]